MTKFKTDKLVLLDPQAPDWKELVKSLRDTNGKKHYKRWNTLCGVLLYPIDAEKLSKLQVQNRAANFIRSKMYPLHWLYFSVHTVIRGTDWAIIYYLTDNNPLKLKVQEYD